MSYCSSIDSVAAVVERIETVRLGTFVVVGGASSCVSLLLLQVLLKVLRMPSSTSRLVLETHGMCDQLDFEIIRFVVVRRCDHANTHDVPLFRYQGVKLLLPPTAIYELSPPRHTLKSVLERRFDEDDSLHGE